MEKKKSWKRKVLKISLVIFGMIILLLVGSVFYIIKSLEPPKIEMTDYYPFISADAKKQCLALFDEWEKSHWPVESESRYIDTSYGKTFVRITGPEDAPPLVLIHGMGSNSLIFYSKIKDLSENFRTYAVDTVGDKGLSICTTPIKKSDDYVQWFDELFNALDLDNNINLMGGSYGAWLISQYAIHKQNRLSKLVLIAPVGTIVPINPQFMRRLLLSTLPFDYFQKSFNLWFDPTINNKSASLQFLGFSNACNKFYKANFILNPNVLNDEELKSIKCPVLFLAGDHERVFSPYEAMDRLERVVPQFKKKIIPGVGHATISDSNLTTETILTFLRE